MNLSSQEHLLGLRLQTGIRSQALLMTQIRVEGLWSLLQLGLVVMAGCDQGTTLCSVDPSVVGCRGSRHDIEWPRLFLSIISFFLVVCCACLRVLQASSRVLQWGYRNCNLQYIR